MSQGSRHTLFPGHVSQASRHTLFPGHVSQGSRHTLHCFLATCRRGHVTHCFLATCRRGHVTHCFLATCRRGHVTHCFLATCRRGHVTHCFLATCRRGHVTHCFLAHDTNSGCWTHDDIIGKEQELWLSNSPLSSCGQSLTAFPVRFVCVGSGDTLPYTLVCDHRQDCLDNSDEEFCVFPPCTGTTPLKCATSRQVRYVQIKARHFTFEFFSFKFFLRRPAFLSISLSLSLSLSLRLPPPPPFSLQFTV